MNTNMQNKILFIFSVFIYSFFLFGSDLIFHKICETKAAVIPNTDLLVESIKVEPSEPVVFEEATIIVRVKNDDRNSFSDQKGLSNFSKSFSNFDISSQTIIYPTIQNPLSHDEYMEYKFEGSFSALGSQTLSFTVDSTDEILERCELNNKYIKQITVMGNDLKADSISVIPANPAQNQDCIITAKIKNAGTYNLWSSFGLDTYAYNIENFNLDKLEYTYPTLGNIIPPNGFMEFKFYGQFKKQGNNIMEFTIDKEKNFEESLEDNNHISKTFTVIDPADINIAVDSISLNKKNPIVNQETEIAVKIKNVGKVSIMEKYGLRYDDAQLDFKSFAITQKSQGDFPSPQNPFESGEFYQFMIKGYFTSTGNYTLTFMVDKDNILGDKDETNNNKIATGTVFLSEDEAEKFRILSQSIENISSSSIKIKWETDKETTGKLIYRENKYGSSETTKSTSGAKKNHEIVLTGLKGGVSYVYHIISVSGKYSEQTQPAVFTTLVNDNVIISKLEFIPDSINDKIKIVWSTNLATDGYVFYKKSGGDEYKKIGTDTKIFYHMFEITNLEPGNYELYATSKSGAGTKDESKKFNIILGNSPEENSKILDEDSGENQTEESVANSEEIIIKNKNLYKNIKGKIILKVENNGEAYYVHPKTESMYFLGLPADAFNIMRSQGVGITNQDLEKIPVGLGNISGSDADGDGLSDLIEDALGTDKNKKDTDSDGFNDKEEVESNYNPLGGGKLNISSSFTAGKIGLIFLQVEGNGEAWYINPSDQKRYFLGRPADAFNAMKYLGLGISNNNFDSL